MYNHPVLEKGQEFRDSEDTWNPGKMK